MAKLKQAEIKKALADVPGWKKKALTITRLYSFKDFPAAIKFVNAVARIAEKSQHHPDIDIRWNKVTLTFTTHDEGGLTSKDFSQAKKVDAIAR